MKTAPRAANATYPKACAVNCFDATGNLHVK